MFVHVKFTPAVGVTECGAVASSSVGIGVGQMLSLWEDSALFDTLHNVLCLLETGMEIMLLKRTTVNIHVRTVELVLYLLSQKHWLGNL